MDYSTSSDFDNNPFASEGGFGNTNTSSITSSRALFGNDDGGFGNEDHTRLPGTAVAGLFGGEDNSPAGGLFDEHDDRAVIGGGFGSSSEHEEIHRRESPQTQEHPPPLESPALHQDPEDPNQKLPASPGPQQSREVVLHHKHDHPPHQSQSQPRRQQGGEGRGQPQGQRQVAQYRLQAKVAALERLGRKDPVIRFDVYVCHPGWSTCS